MAEALAAEASVAAVSAEALAASAEAEAAAAAPEDGKWKTIQKWETETNEFYKRVSEQADNGG